MKLDRFLFKLHRVVSWVLLPFMVVVAVSGYAYVRKIQFLHRGLAFNLHDTLDLPLLLLIVAHVVLAGRIELRRFKIRGKAVDVLLLVLGIAAALVLTYVDVRIPR